MARHSSRTLRRLVEPDPLARESAGLSAHILPTSATMIGVCMTVLSIGRIGAGGNWHMLIDKALAVDALIFLTSAFMSFAAMRVSLGSRRYERWADGVFVFGLGLLVVVALSLAFTIR
jgi:hypothetical protein